MLTTTDFDYTLPEAQIARYPLSKRSASRLLCLGKSSGQIKHRHFYELTDLLKPGDLLVCNNTKVIPARLFGQKDTGGKVEVLVERIIDAHHVLAHVGASKTPKPGATLFLDGGIKAVMTGRRDELFELEFAGDDTALALLEQFGHIPLPPYIDRADEKDDKERYQTVFAKHKGAVAAPTAGLHFDDELMSSIKKQGVDIEYLTLHVGAGTFQPVRVDNILEHKMHAEYIDVSAALCEKINATQAKGGRIIAVGTTVVRAVESAAKTGELKPYQGDTDIFIYPGFKFQIIDAMITNFHLPKSTLMMLVSAFAGHKTIMHAYQQAVKEKYRFYSYGDAMFIG